MPCFPKEISYKGSVFSYGELIGSGAFGKVYHLESSEGKISDRFVAKVVFHSDHKGVKAIVDDELRLDELLPDFYTKTEHIETIRFENQFRSKVYAGILLKKKVNGLTLNEMMDQSQNQILSTPTKIKKAYMELEKFKKNLGEVLFELALQGMYVYDLHPKNIMYDGKRWYVVDAISSKDLQDMVFYFDRPLYADNNKYENLKKLEFQAQQWSSRLFTEFVNIQLGRAGERLKKLYLQQL